MSDLMPPSDGDDYKNAKANARAAKAYAKAQRPWFKKKRFIIPIAFVAISIIGGISGGGDDKTPTASTPAEDAADESSAPVEEESTAPVEKKKKPKAIAVTAKRILQEFEDNEAAADAKYDGKRIKVTGIVDKVDTEIFNDDEYVVQVGEGGDWVLWTVNCDDQTEVVASQYKKGQTVTATGDFEDGGDLGVEMHGCVLS